METKRIDYKALCEALFEMDAPYEDNFPLSVPVATFLQVLRLFRVVIAKGACKVVIGQQGKEFWGITGLDTKTGETQWYNYNDCVSLENWAVLDRLLKTRFGWMELTDPALVIETKMLAKAQLGN